jgi:hypothetical protein
MGGAWDVMSHVSLNLPSDRDLKRTCEMTIGLPFLSVPGAVRSPKSNNSRVRSVPGVRFQMAIDIVARPADPAGSGINAPRLQMCGSVG